MGRTRKKEGESIGENLEANHSRPILTSESREKYLISLAYDLVEKRLKEGTATSQETTHFLKLGTKKERLEEDILEKQKELITAKTEALQSAKRVEELYAEAFKAFRTYNGDQEDFDDEPED